MKNSFGSASGCTTCLRLDSGTARACSAYWSDIRSRVKGLTGGHGISFAAEVLFTSGGQIPNQCKGPSCGMELAPEFNRKPITRTCLCDAMRCDAGRLLAQCRMWCGQLPAVGQWAAELQPENVFHLHLPTSLQHNPGAEDLYTCRYSPCGYQWGPILIELN